MPSANSMSPLVFRPQIARGVGVGARLRCGARRRCRRAAEVSARCVSVARGVGVARCYGVTRGGGVARGVGWACLEQAHRIRGRDSCLAELVGDSLGYRGGIHTQPRACIRRDLRPQRAGVLAWPQP